MNHPLRVLHALAAAVYGPLWCRVAGHGEPVGPTDVNGEWRFCCLRCGEWL